MGKKKSAIPDFAGRPTSGKSKPKAGGKRAAPAVQTKQTVTPKTTSARSGHR